MSLGKYLKKLRKENNMTQKDMADTLSISFSTYLKIEQGVSTALKKKYIESLCEFTDKSEKDIYKSILFTGYIEDISDDQEYYFSQIIEHLYNPSLNVLCKLENIIEAKGLPVVIYKEKGGNEYTLCYAIDNVSYNIEELDDKFKIATFFLWVGLKAYDLFPVTYNGCKKKIHVILDKNNSKHLELYKVLQHNTFDFVDARLGFIFYDEIEDQKEESYMPFN